MPKESETEEFKLRENVKGRLKGGFVEIFGNFLNNVNSFEPLLWPSRWTDRKADRHSLTIRPCCCLPPSRAGFRVKRLGDGERTI